MIWVSMSIISNYTYGERQEGVDASDINGHRRLYLRQASREFRRTIIWASMSITCNYTYDEHEEGIDASDINRHHRLASGRHR